MFEGIDFTILYTPVTGVKYLRNNISIASAEFMITFLLDIHNTYQNSFLTNPKETSMFVYNIFTWIGSKESSQIFQ